MPLTNQLEIIIDDVLAANPKNVEDFKAGKANPGQVNALLMKKLG